MPADTKTTQVSMQLTSRVW